MFIRVDVSESANCPMSMTRMFEAVEDVVEVTRVRASDPKDNEALCDITGWCSETGPCPAYAVLVEDSGDGIARLIYGGDEGIRLKAVGLLEEWDLTSRHQWGEACLLLDKDVELR